MNSKWISHTMKFPTVSRLYVTRIARLRTGVKTGDMGTLPYPEVEQSRPVDRLGPLRSYRSLLHLVHYGFKPLSHREAHESFFRRQHYDLAIFSRP